MIAAKQPCTVYSTGLYCEILRTLYYSRAQGAVRERTQKKRLQRPAWPDQDWSRACSSWKWRRCREETTCIPLLGDGQPQGRGKQRAETGSERGAGRQCANLIRHSLFSPRASPRGTKQTSKQAVSLTLPPNSKKQKHNTIKHRKKRRKNAAGSTQSAGLAVSAVCDRTRCTRIKTLRVCAALGQSESAPTRNGRPGVANACRRRPKGENITQNPREIRLYSPTRRQPLFATTRADADLSLLAKQNRRFFSTLMSTFRHTLNKTTTKLAPA